MIQITQNETAKIIRDLLQIAKVAMPGKLYDEDPRVATAAALLGQWETGVSPARAPNVTSRPPNFDITALAQTRAVEQSASGIAFLVELPWDIVRGLTTSQGDLVPHDPSEAVNFIMRDWLAGRNYLPAE
jgi:hypothetical protein